MAYPNLSLIEALRETAKRLKEGSPYAWGNHGVCNCGNLLQVVTLLKPEEILTYAHSGIGEWTELAAEYCPTTNTPINLLLKKLQQLGLTPTDIHNVEYLEDRAVLETLEGGFRWLKRNKREDVITYFEAYATLLENQLIDSIQIPQSLLQPVYHQMVESY